MWLEYVRTGLLLGLVVAAAAAAAEGDQQPPCSPHTLNTSTIIFQSPGNLSITGIVNVHGGDACGGEASTAGLERAAAAVWAATLLNQQNYLPGYQIGLTIFDGCGNNAEIQKAFVQSLVLENCLKPNVTSLGTFVSSEIKPALDPLATGLNKSLTTIGGVVSTGSLVTMLAQLLQVMSINTVHRVIADTHDQLAQFGTTMANQGVCVYDQVIVDDRHAVNNEILDPPEETLSEIVSKGSPVIVVITSSQKLGKFFDSLQKEMTAMTDIIWILAPTDGIFEMDLDFLPNNLFVLSVVWPKKEKLEDFLKNGSVISEPLNYRLPMKSPLFLTATAAILEILAPLKDVYKTCELTNETCIQVSEFIENVESKTISMQTKRKGTLSQQDITEIYEALKMPVDDETSLFTVQAKGKVEDVALFKMYDSETFQTQPKLMIFKDRRKRSIVRVGIEDIQNRGERSTTTTTTSTSTEEAITRIAFQRSTNGSGKHPCHEALGNLPSVCGICQNFVKYLSQAAGEEKEGEKGESGVGAGAGAVGWRFHTWVTINASLVAMGSLCAVAIFIFVVSRICLGDVLEGSPALSFFLIIAILITYLATLPFSFESEADSTISALICDLRMCAPPLTYSILFSIMLSRSLMLAASDQDGGFMSHVNGYLQAVVVFFTCAVQFAISGEYWLYNSYLLSSTPVYSCATMYDSGKFLFLLAYDAFLLVIMLSVIPFMCRAKRNYKEGTFFSITIIVIFLLWCAWITLFFIMPEYRDAAVLLGLTGTPTAIILCVFIPRTYLMTTALVRDRIVNTLPSLAQTDNQFRSTQALYDTLNLASKTGAPNPNFYSVNPTDSGPGTPQIQPPLYYSHGLPVPPSKKVQLASNSSTRAGAEASIPDTMYQQFDSPLRSPSRITRF